LRRPRRLANGGAGAKRELAVILRGHAEGGAAGRDIGR
jgi:hypothetical protein